MWLSHPHTLTPSHPHRPSSEDRKEAARCNYERYRSVVQNHFHGTSEQDALSRIAVDELFTGEPKRSGRDKKKCVPEPLTLSACVVNTLAEELS